MTTCRFTHLGSLVHQRSSMNYGESLPLRQGHNAKFGFLFELLTGRKVSPIAERCFFALYPGLLTEKLPAAPVSDLNDSAVVDGHLFGHRKAFGDSVRSLCLSGEFIAKPSYILCRWAYYSQWINAAFYLRNPLRSCWCGHFVILSQIWATIYYTHKISLDTLR